VAEMMFPVSARSGLMARMSDMDSLDGVAGGGCMTAALRRRIKSLPSRAPVSILFWKDWPSWLVMSGAGDAAMAWSTLCREKKLGSSWSAPPTPCDFSLFTYS
jgi:hypothetical protein